MNTDHIINNGESRRMECQNCGVTQAVKTPALIDDLLSEFDAFTEAHKGCARPQIEAVMSEYIKGFDAGYGYALNEVEKYIKQNEYDPQRVAPLLILLAHLKMEKTT